MAIIPVRGLGTLGVISDVPPYDTPINAFSEGRNVSFRSSKVSHAPALKDLKNNYTLSGNPTGILDASFLDQYGHIIVTHDNGKIDQVSNGTLTDVTPTDGLNPSSQQVSSLRTSGVDYINMEGNPPLYRSRVTDTFEPLPNWASNSHAKTLRTYKDFLIALNVSKGADEYPTMVKWSDAIQYGSAPLNWDVTDSSSLAGENVINMTGSLVDGLGMGTGFILYGTKEVYRMDYIGEPFVFRFDPVFSDFRIMGKNCAAVVDNVHYVFCEDDIYKHDGVRKISITKGRVHHYIYDRLDPTKLDKCFTFHDPRNKEVIFVYAVNDDSVRHLTKEVTGCNEAAVYNYEDDTWSFVDMPSVVGMTASSIPEYTDWDDTRTWSDLTFSWRYADGDQIILPLIVTSGTPEKAPTLLFRDDPVTGMITNSLSQEYQYDGFLISQHKDLDDAGLGIYGRKMVRTLYPQVYTTQYDTFLTLRLGSSSTPTGIINWGNEGKLNVRSDVKYDTRVNGRYLSIYIGIPTETEVQISGFDADLIPISGR